ncbi:MAG: YggS family pyridoxal phosphate-dependent enzyme [Vulcanimicrobiaceae bacterium]
MPSIASRYAELKRDLAAELCACGRAPGSVRIVAVTKRQPLDALREAVVLGIEEIGESYLQEARPKLRAFPKLRAHFIGHLQTNKASGIAAAFDVIQSVDRLEAGLALAKAAQALGKRLPVLLQVNISPSERFGVRPEEAVELAEALRALPSLELDGVMAIGPLTEDPDARARSFERAAALFGQVGGSTLSLGMSGDWRQAVRAGSTLIRIGTALFGPRS